MLVCTIYESYLHVKLGAVCPQATSCTLTLLVGSALGLARTSLR